MSSHFFKNNHHHYSTYLQMNQPCNITPNDVTPPPKRITPTPAHAATAPNEAHAAALQFRPYQKRIFDDRTRGILILHWARQLGKSYVLAPGPSTA